MSLPDSTFRDVVKNTPLVAIDLVITDPSGAILMGWRENEPAKGTWFVPGGRIRKDEKIADAFERIIRTETGLAKRLTDSRFGGVYEHLYSTNRFADASFGTHYCVLAYLIPLSERPHITIDSQHSMVQWLTLSSAGIHPYSRAYFDLLKSAVRPQLAPRSRPMRMSEVECKAGVDHRRGVLLASFISSRTHRNQIAIKIISK